MQSKATTVIQYLAELPPDRRETIEVVRRVILKSIDRKKVEEMKTSEISPMRLRTRWPPSARV